MSTSYPGGLIPTVNVYTYVLDPVKGWHHDGALDSSCELASAQEWNRGAVFHKDDVTGLAVVGISGNSMPLFSMQSTTDPDVMANGKVTGLVATGGYEVLSSEYVDTDVYQYNDHVTAGVTGDADAGLLKIGTFGDDLIVGVVSRPPHVHIETYGIEVLGIWTVYLPAVGASETPS